MRKFHRGAKMCPHEQSAATAHALEEQSELYIF